MQTLDDLAILKLINGAFGSSPFGGTPRELYEPLEYILALGGKRIRPVMLLMACDMYGGDLQAAIPAALGIELFHNFSLIHDDIMDNAPIRRGKPTIHRRWDTNTALLSGDTMLVKAFEKMLLLPGPILKPAMDLFTRTAGEVCEGQQFDMNFEKQPEVTLEDYLEMIRLKTAVLIGASLYIGGLAGGAGEKDLQRLYDFGIHTGLAFQLRDDLLDAYGDEKVFGKKPYGDIRANKKTYPYLVALHHSGPREREKLIRLFSGTTADDEEKIRETMRIFDLADVKRLTEESIRMHHLEAMDHFNALEADPGRKRTLKDYVEVLTGRSF